MKKKILIYFMIFALIVFSFANLLDCNAEELPTEDTITEEIVEDEVEEPTQEPTIEEVVEGEEEFIQEDEEITFNDQVKEFLDKWGTPIISAVAGVTGSSITVFICKFIISKLVEKIEEERKKSKENNKEANEKLAATEKKLEFAKIALEEAEKQLTTQAEKLVEILANQKEILSQDQKFKELIAIMFATTPELMNNGVASKVLDLLDEKEVKDNE